MQQLARSAQKTSEVWAPSTCGQSPANCLAQGAAAKSNVRSPPAFGAAAKGTVSAGGDLMLDAGAAVKREACTEVSTV